jgi:hypothetical protein
MAILPGTRLGPYEALSAVGAGGMGETLNAANPKEPQNLERGGYL